MNAPAKKTTSPALFGRLLRRLRVFRRRVIIACLVAASGLALFILGCNLLIELRTKAFIFQDVQQIGHQPVGLVLGTSSRFASGAPNLFFKYRMEAAAEVFQAGKVSHLLLSGDNRFSSYNEPLEMKRALMSKGVPESAITLDYAGLRTLDSVIRAKRIFGQQQLTIISQRSHVERAVFIARHHDIQAFGLSAQRVPLGISAKTTVREWLARCKAVLDLYILRKQPRHLGTPEPITLAKPLAAKETKP